MTDLKKKIALTLTELLVASVLIGIVMAGVAAFSATIKNLQDASTQGSILSMRTSAAILQLRKDAEATVGVGFTDVLEQGGIVYYDETTIYPWLDAICFRQDSDNDPANFDNDLFNCYKYSGPPHFGTDRAIFRCADLANPYVGILYCGVIGGPTATKLLNVTDSVFFSVEKDDDDRIKYITLSLTTRDDVFKPKDPFTNPEYSITAHVSPVGLSR